MMVGLLDRGAALCPRNKRSFLKEKVGVLGKSECLMEYDHRPYLEGIDNELEMQLQKNLASWEMFFGIY
jgi:hypothetical protein